MLEHMVMQNFLPYGQRTKERGRRRDLKGIPPVT
jgi:hypothetical protein